MTRWLVVLLAAGALLWVRPSHAETKFIMPVHFAFGGVQFPDETGGPFVPVGPALGAGLRVDRWRFGGTGRFLYAHPREFLFDVGAFVSLDWLYVQLGGGYSAAIGLEVAPTLRLDIDPADNWDLYVPGFVGARALGFSLQLGAGPVFAFPNGASVAPRLSVETRFGCELMEFARFIRDRGHAEKWKKKANGRAKRD